MYKSDSGLSVYSNRFHLIKYFAFRKVRAFNLLLLLC